MDEKLFYILDVRFFDYSVEIFLGRTTRCANISLFM